MIGMIGWIGFNRWFLSLPPTTKRRGLKIELLIAVRNVHRRDLIAWFQFSPEGFSVAEKTIKKFLARTVRLYEQERGKPSGPLAWTVRGAVGEMGKKFGR